MDDKTIMQRIEELVNEEHALMQRSTEDLLQEDERQRMHQLEVNLDQCWDLLRQRRARRHAGLNPDDAQVRDPSVVENYQQ